MPRLIRWVCRDCRAAGETLSFPPGTLWWDMHAALVAEHYLVAPACYAPVSHLEIEFVYPERKVC